MSNMELEMKILNVDEKSLREKIEKLGGKYISTSNQFLYVYEINFLHTNILFYTILYHPIFQAFSTFSKYIHVALPVCSAHIYHSLCTMPDLL